MRRRHTKRRAKLIEEHTYMVHQAVNVFLRQHPEFSHLHDDLQSEGCARLVDSVDRFINGMVKNLKAYLRLSIRSGLWEAARTDDVIQSPRNCPARQYRGQELSSYSKPGETQPDVGNEQLLDLACIDESDYLLIRMLRSGATLRSIADELMLSIDDVQQKGQQIGERLRKLIDG